MSGWVPPPSPPGPPGPPPGYGQPYSSYGPMPPGGPGQGEQPRKKRTLAVVLAVVGAALVVGLAVLIPVVVSEDDDGEGDADRRSSQESEKDGEDRDDPPAADATLDEVQVFDDLEQTHTTDPVDYPQSPPIGGAHHPTWLDCGVYDEPVSNEHAVHDLEHGTVWITYDPEQLSDDDVGGLEDQLPPNGMMSPYAELSAPVVVTVWGRQLELDGAEDPRLELFIGEFGAGETAPEPFASCVGGSADPDGS